MMLLQTTTITTTATTMALIKPPQQINYRFDINNRLPKFCFGSFLNGYVVEPYIVCSRPIKAIQNGFLYSNSKILKLTTVEY